jgi:intergrase/recombinase
MTDDEPKSAWQLAMERFRKQDAEQGAVEQSLSQEQKVAIEECRRFHKAKVAELEIMYKSKLAVAQDTESCEKLESAYRRELERAAEDRDRVIARIRAGK